MRIYPANFTLFRVWFAVLLWLLFLATGIGLGDYSFAKIHPGADCGPLNVRRVALAQLAPLPIDKLLLLPVAMFDGLWAGALLCLPGLILLAFGAVAFAGHAYLRRRALGIVTVPLVCLILGIGGFAYVGHVLGTTGCYPQFVGLPGFDESRNTEPFTIQRRP